MLPVSSSNIDTKESYRIYKRSSRQATSRICSASDCSRATLLPSPATVTCPPPTRWCAVWVCRWVLVVVSRLFQVEPNPRTPRVDWFALSDCLSRSYTCCCLRHLLWADVVTADKALTPHVFPPLCETESEECLQGSLQPRSPRMINT